MTPALSISGSYQSMSVVVSHPTGNANLRAVLRSLERAGMLHAFHTSLAMPVGNLSRIFGSTFDCRIGQRRFPEVLRRRIQTHPGLELLRLGARRFGPEALIRHETGWASVDAVYRAVDQAVARSLERAGSEIKAIYAYEDGALKSFRAAKRCGMTRFYDLPIAHWATLRHLLNEEADRLPDWASTMEGLQDSAEKHARKDEEIALADHIFVASTFTKSSLEKMYGANLPVTIVPYGCPEPLVMRPAYRGDGEPLQIFYAGHLAQRKGIADLIAALGMLSIDWRLTLAGPCPVQPPAALGQFLADPRCTWLGVLPHSQLLKAMTQAHLFVFPSIVEGFGMVITEAIAAGLPVITTSHTAGPDFLSEGHDGFIVPIRDPCAIAEKITLLAENECLRRMMAQNAISLARNMSWFKYEQRLLAVIVEMLQ
jgi:starch synthase